MSSPTTVGIWNRALQLLGSSFIQNTDDTSARGVACRGCYEATRDALYETYPFRFTIQIATLAAGSPAPDFGRANSFDLPTDWLAMASDYPEDNFAEIDYEIQGRKIFSDATPPLYIRYVARIADPVLMTPTFRELCAAAMADNMCEALTQSNQKKQACERKLAAAWRDARRANSRSVRPQVPPEDTWLSTRRG